MCESYFRSKLLRKTMTVEDKESEGYLPCLEEDLQFFEVPECFVACTELLSLAMLNKFRCHAHL